MSSLAALAPILHHTPVATPAQALTTMVLIEQALAPAASAPADGIAWFNRLYMKVAQSVIDAVEGGTFQHPPYIAKLDVTFANYYFAALLAFLEDTAAVPRSWWPVFSGRERADVAPIQFAFAGMNAHINRDLPAALAALWLDSSSSLPPREAQKQDYARMNGLLARVEAEVKTWFLTGKWQRLDAAFHGADDIIASFSIAEARQAAWIQGDVLVALGGIGAALGASYLEALDGVVGLAGRGLLTATRRD